MELRPATTEVMRRYIEAARARVYRVRRGEIAEVSIFEGDQYAVDALFASRA
jgi:uncharacterized protein YcgI (DUF1989 family)